MKNLPVILLIILLTFSCSEKMEPTNVITICGTVSLEEGCSAATDSLIAYGIALIHHMTYAEAELAHYLNLVFKGTDEIGISTKTRRLKKPFLKLPHTFASHRKNLNKNKYPEVNLYFQNESRFGLTTHTSRCLTAIGVKAVIS